MIRTDGAEGPLPTTGDVARRVQAGETHLVEASPPAAATIHSRISTNPLHAKRKRRGLFPVVFEHVGDATYRRVLQ